MLYSCTHMATVDVNWLNVKQYSYLYTQLRATGRHLPCGITQCYLPPDTGERAPPNSRQKGWYSGTRFTYPGGMEG